MQEKLGPNICAYSEQGRAQALKISLSSSVIRAREQRLSLGMLGYHPGLQGGLVCAGITNMGWEEVPLKVYDYYPSHTLGLGSIPCRGIKNYSRFTRSCELIFLVSVPRLQPSRV
jgi:hypothetical protein